MTIPFGQSPCAQVGNILALIVSLALKISMIKVKILYYFIMICETMRRLWNRCKTLRTKRQLIIMSARFEIQHISTRAFQKLIQSRCTIRSSAFSMTHARRRSDSRRALERRRCLLRRILRAIRRKHRLWHTDDMIFNSSLIHRQTLKNSYPILLSSTGDTSREPTCLMTQAAIAVGIDAHHHASLAKWWT